MCYILAMESCLFCKIIEGVIPSTKLYEDDTVLAFIDIQPVNIGHALIVPKTHAVALYDLPDETLSHMAPVIKRLAGAIKRAVGADGINIAMNNDPAAGQVIPHAHIHIIPRHERDGFPMWKGPRGYEDGEAAEISEKIKAELI
jgi:histidine triad (HIT) family protein